MAGKSCVWVGRKNGKGHDHLLPGRGRRGPDDVNKDKTARFEEKPESGEGSRSMALKKSIKKGKGDCGRG